MARTIIRSGETEEKASTAAKTVTKAAETAEKKAPKVVAAKPAKGSAAGYRIGAIVLWILAIACEVLAIMALFKDLTIRFTQDGNTNMLIMLIGFIVLDLIFAILAAQLWKKANHIDPPSEKNKFLFYLISELGVIMACICFIPLIIILLKNNKLDKKSKTIVAIVAIAALLITGFTSADYHPVSAEKKTELESSLGDYEGIFWTTFGHKYHIDENCQAIRQSNTLHGGNVTEAIESGRTAICSFCLNHAERDENGNIILSYTDETGVHTKTVNASIFDSIVSAVEENLPNGEGE